MKAIADFPVFSIPINEFRLMTYNAAFVRRKGGEEVEASNQLITLDDNVFIVVELVSEEPSQGVTLKLVTLPDRLVSRLSEEDPCLLVRGVGEMPDGSSVEDLLDLLLRHSETLLVTIQPIIAVAMQPVQTEQDGFTIVCDGADVLKIDLGGVMSQGFLREEETL